MLAVKSVSPDTQLYFTVPCYYDNPQDDSLPYIELFRDYLRTLGKLTPNDIVWVLEDRGPASIVAYSHYLEGRCVNYRYPLPGQGGFWSTNFTSAKAAAGYTDAYWFCVGHYEQDLLLAGGAQYMWNPELPTDYEYIVKVMVPQACKFLYGSAWREMAEFFVNVNVNDILLQRAKQVAVVRAGQEKVRRAIELLTAARDKVEPALADGRIGIERLLARMQAAEQWLGMRLAISEALDRCQRAETLIAFEQSDKAQEVLAEAEELLGRLEAGKVGQYSWLKGDYEQATARCKKLKEVISKGESAEASLFVLPLDGQWRFRLDPEDIGREEKWFAVDCDRSDWADITVPGLWEQSGLGGAVANYNGIAWYARSFRVPPAWRGRRIVLHVGACDDEAWVYVNGKFVGDHLEKDHPQVAWEEPFELDITDVVKWDSDNTVVVRVSDTHGGGGIWKSVYLRADEAAAKPRAPGPGEVEIQPSGRQGAVPGEAAAGQQSATPQAKAIRPGWSARLSCPAGVQVTVGFRGYGDDVRNTAGRELTDKELQWLADNGVGKLVVSSFIVDGKQLVIQDRYPGFWPAFSYIWDGYGWTYQSLEAADVVKTDNWQAVACRGRSFCANYGRFETWMRYEYEIGIRADGVGYERLVLIPEHDTDFSPVRNGPPYGSGAVPSVSGVQLPPGYLPSGFTAALVAPFADIPARPMALDYASDQTIWEGNVEARGLVGAYDPGRDVYLALLAAGQEGMVGAVQQFDAQGYPGEAMQISLLRPVVKEWAAESRNEFLRWFATGTAGTAEEAIARLEKVRTRLSGDSHLPAFRGE